MFCDSFTFRMSAHSSKFTSLVCSDIALRDLLKSLLFGSGVHFLRTLRCGERFAFFSIFWCFGPKTGYFGLFCGFLTKFDFSIFLIFLRWFGSRLSPEILRRDHAKNDKIRHYKVTLGPFWSKMKNFNFLVFGAHFGPLPDLQKVF